MPLLSSILIVVLVTIRVTTDNLLIVGIGFFINKPTILRSAAALPTTNSTTILAHCPH